jgi:hypothetical protein
MTVLVERCRSSMALGACVRPLAENDFFDVDAAAAAAATAAAAPAAAARDGRDDVTTGGDGASEGSASLSSIPPASSSASSSSSLFAFAVESLETCDARRAPILLPRAVAIATSFSGVTCSRISCRRGCDEGTTWVRCYVRRDNVHVAVPPWTGVSGYLSDLVQCGLARVHREVEDAAVEAEAEVSLSTTVVQRRW